MESLTTEEQSDLQLLEEGIARTLDSTITCARLLFEVRERALWRMKYVDFKSYIAERWPQIGRSHLYRLLAAGEVAANVPEIESERQAREISEYSAELQPIVWKIAKETAPTDGEGNPLVTGTHLRAVGDVLLGILTGGGMDDGCGEHKPLGVLLTAAVTEEVYERILRQQETIKEKLQNKTRNAATAKDVPTLSAARALMNLVTSFIKGIERMNIDRGTKMHPALADPYHFGKALIGEMTGETRLLIDDVNSEGDCEACPDSNVLVTDVALTVNMNGSGLKSVRLKICDQCIHRYIGALQVVENAEVVER